MRLSIRETASFLHAVRHRHKAIVVLRAYFDESGIHRGAKTSGIWGFVGAPDDWEPVETRWRDRLDRLRPGLGFHAVEFENREGPWAPFERHERDPVRDDLAAIVGASGLIPIGSGYHGIWRPEMFDPLEPGRYPTAYSFCFEAVMEQLIKCSNERFDGEPIAVMFARQDEYESRALKYYGIFRHNNLWGSIVDPIAFGDARTSEPLQAADMLAYETYQCHVGGRPLSKPRWPLIAEMWPDPTEATNPRNAYNGFHTEQTLAAMIARGPLQKLQVPKKADPLARGKSS